MASTTDVDFFENHEFRINNLEAWRDRYESSAEQRVTQITISKIMVESLREDMIGHEKHLEKQDDKLSKMNDSINKMILGVAATIIMTLVKIVLDLTIFKK